MNEYLDYPLNALEDIVRLYQRIEDSENATENR